MIIACAIKVALPHRKSYCLTKMESVMISEIKSKIIAKMNHDRIARILREIDRPRNEAISEARLSARQYEELEGEGKCSYYQGK